METSLKELAEHYAREADDLERVIDHAMERRRVAAARGDSPESKRQERLIELHQQQQADLIRLAAQLRNYYGDGEQ